MENIVMLSCSRAFRSNSRFSHFAATLGLAALGLAGSHPALAQTAVLTQNNDNARSGSNTAETTLTPQNVKVATFGKLFTMTGLNANVNGQVLYVPGVTIGGATHNVVYAYTSNNTDNSPCGVYAYDADTGTQLWKTILPNSATYTTATPVIDPATNTMYVLTKTGNDDTGSNYLHAFDITTGQDKTGSPIQIAASANGTGDGSVGGKVYFDGNHGNGRFHANDRAALLLVNGVVYTSFAHNSDSFPYHGWVLAYQYTNGAFSQVASFCTTPNGGDGGVWQAGKGLTADAAGNLYFSIGNGTFDAPSGGKDYGMCYMKLSPSLQVLDYFAPFDEQSQSNGDLDLGNSGLTGIPGTAALFGGGTKFGSAFLLDSGNLGKFTPGGPDKVLARIDGVSGNDDVGQNPISWDSGTYKYVYLWPGGQPVEQFQYDPTAGTFKPTGIFAKASSAVTDGGSLAVSSSGTSNAILWAIGDNGTVRAYDATNVAAPELWDSAQNSSRDSVGHSGHFQFPTVVNGKVYVPTGGSTIAVYGLLQTTPVSQSVYQIDAGGGAATPFAADADFSGGSTYATGAAISTAGVTNAAPPAVYQSERFGNFTYTLPNLTPGASYTLRLHFAEIYWTAAGQRVFNVAVNGQPALTNFDIFAAAGGANKAVVETLPVTADASGKVTVTFTTVRDNAKISGLELLSSPSGAAPAAPTGLAAVPGDTQVTLSWTGSPAAASYTVYRGTVSGSETLLKSGLTMPSYTDTGLTNGTTYFYQVAAANNAGISAKSGEVSTTPAVTASTPVYQINAGGGQAGTFSADRNVSTGGTYIVSAPISTTGVTNAAPPAVYQSERFGNFTYTLPNLTPGASYTLRLHFAEIYWTAAGQRVFNVAVNGQPALTNFDIFAAAGGANKAVVETLPVTADASGKVTVTFTTVKDNAKISGLELLH